MTVNKEFVVLGDVNCDVLTQATKFILPFEGFRRYRYFCPAGLITIGYGHVIRPREKIEEPLSKEKAEKLLRRDLVRVKKQLDQLVEVELTILQEIALLSFIFNVGGMAFQRSTLRQKLNRDMHDEVVNEFYRWVKARGRKLQGLVRRRDAEAKLYAEGTLIDEGCLPVY
ncbi:MAG: hypothetical protein CMM87_02760 [Rickettsiales bacterium]|nr:hypothetical protein [Rickettsiales bacterium]|tara:strand:- start:6883 stop:7392 length:510 start_codon:yes stop_codon:yes gene_type:complete